MLSLSTVLPEVTSADISRDSRLLGVTRGSTAKILHTRDLTQVAEFSFPEEVVQFSFSEDCLKFLVISK